MQTATIEIPLEAEQEIKRIAPNQDVKDFVLDLIYRGIESLEDRELEEKALKAKESGLMTEKETENFITELKNS